MRLYGVAALRRAMLSIAALNVSAGGDARASALALQEQVMVHVSRAGACLPVRLSANPTPLGTASMPCTGRAAHCRRRA